MKFNCLMKRICLAMLFAVGLLGASALAQQSGGVAAGKGGAIYAKQKCTSCHGASGEGGVGPKLIGNKRLSDADYVIHQIIHGGSGMPAFGKKLSAQQIADVATFVRTSWGNSFGKVTKAQVEQGGGGLGGAVGKNGKQVYNRSGCAECHGASGQGAIGPALAGDGKLKNAGFIIAQVVNGGGIMPPFAGRLNNAQIADVASYIRTNWGNSFGKVTKDTVETFRGVSGGGSGGQSGGAMSGGQSGGAANKGAQLFAQQGCAACHGSSGEGGIGPRLAGDTELKHAAFVVTQILHGGGVMPAFEGRLSAAQIAKVATYIRTSWGNNFGKVTQAQVENPGGGLSGASGGQQPSGGQSGGAASGGQPGGQSGGAKQSGGGQSGSQQSGGQSGGAVSGGAMSGGQQSGGAVSGGQSGGAVSAGAKSGGASSGTSSMTFTATLTGKHEAPPTSSKGTGKAMATLKGHTLTIHGSFQGLSSPLFKVKGTPAHIHQAPEGLSGPIVFKLVVQPGGQSGGASGGQASGGTFKGTFTLTNAQIKALKAMNFYVNVHTKKHPDGAIRGQLLANQGGASGGGQSGGQ
jgi:mono/diheme cytochrome c family protein